MALGYNLSAAQLQDDCAKDQGEASQSNEPDHYDLSPCLAVPAGFTVSLDDMNWESHLKNLRAEMYLPLSECDVHVRH